MLKLQHDPAIVAYAVAGIIVVFLFVKAFLHFNPPDAEEEHSH
jgi:hypothetical protein